MSKDIRLSRLERIIGPAKGPQQSLEALAKRVASYLTCGKPGDGAYERVIDLLKIAQARKDASEA